MRCPVQASTMAPWMHSQRIPWHRNSIPIPMSPSYKGTVMGKTPVGLENNLASHVFTPARRTVLDLLSSQAAISLQNAELYAKLERENAERRQSEAALRRSEERYALAVDAATDGHADWIVDEDIYYQSPRLLEQWGLPPGLAINKRQQALDLFPPHPDDRARVVALLNQHRDSNTTRLEFDTRVIRRGEVRWMHCTTLYVRDAAGRLLRVSTA